MSSVGIVREASQALDIPDSPVGYHCLNVPSWVSNPPIEAVVFAWGASEDHQLGLDTVDNIDCPKVVESLLGLKFMGRSFVGCPLIGGSRNTLAIDADGGLWSWGWNDRGTLGHGHRELQRKPAPVEGLAGVKIVQAAIGGWHCLALSDEGQVYCWGGNEYQQCGYVSPEDAADLQRQSSSAAGADSLLAAAAAGMKSGPGYNTLESVDSTANGGPATANGHMTFSGAGAHDVQGGYVYGASAAGDALWVLPTARDILVPRRCMPGLKVKQVACGGMNSVVLTEGGEVWTWGEPWGEFALELQRAPRKVPGATNIAAIACGAFHNMALVADGRVLSWGTNDYGQLGNGSTIYSTTPVEVLDLEDVAVADIAAGGWHSMALTADGQIYVWGRGEYGRLGIADRTGSSKLRPHKVRGLEGHCVVQVAAGGTHSLAVTSTGRMFIWGRASYGRLGLGSGGKDCYSPVEAALPGGHERWKIAAATAGGRHTMCLAVPVRDTSQRLRDTDAGSKAASVAGNSRAPSRAASVHGDFGTASSAAAAGSSSSSNNAGSSMRQVSSSQPAAAAPAAAAAAAEKSASNDRRGLGFDPFAAAQHQQPPASTSDSHPAAGAGADVFQCSAGQQSASAAAGGSSSSNRTTHPAATAVNNGISGNSSSHINRLGSVPQIPHNLPPALSLQSSYSFAPSPGSSIAGTGSPPHRNTSDNLAIVGGSFSPTGRAMNPAYQPLGQGMGVEAVHAAALAAAATAQQLGALRVGSPGLGSVSGSSSIRQQQSLGGGGGSSSGILRAGQQAPMSPRAMLPPMSPSQRRVGFDTNSTLAAYGAEMDGDGVEGSSTTQQANRQTLSDDAAAIELMQLEEENERRESEELENEQACDLKQNMSASPHHAHQQQQPVFVRHRLSRPGSSTELTLVATPAATAGSMGGRPGSPDYTSSGEPSTLPGPLSLGNHIHHALVAKDSRGLPTGFPLEGGHIRRSGSYQGLAILGSRPSSPSLLQQTHSPDAGVLHTSSSRVQSGGSAGVLQPGLEALSLPRQQSQQLAAAMASSYSRIDASRQASAASLPSLSAGLGVGSRVGPPITRVDSGVSHSGVADSQDDPFLGGASPTGSSDNNAGHGIDQGFGDSGSAGGNGAGSPQEDKALHNSVTGTSPPRDYNVGLDEDMARYATSLPEREFMHRSTHVG